jgi:predicted dehydrogenase
MALTVALLGYGLGGRVLHAPLIAAAGFDLAAIVTGNAERAAQASADFPGARIVPSAEALWADPGELDLAVIVTANVAHVPNALAALDAGLAVVVDKPMAPDLEGARTMADAAERAGRPFSVYQNRRWDADYLTLRGLLDDGALGDVWRFESRWDRWRPEPKPGAWRERGAPEEGGGTLLDLGPHLVDQALVAFGPAETVYAEVAARRAGVEADDDWFIALRHASGVLSHLGASQVAAQDGRRIRVLGSRGAWVKAGLDPQEAALREGVDPSAPGWGAEAETDLGRLVAGEEERVTPGVPGDMGAYYRELHAALRGEGPLPVTAAEGLAVMEVLDAARRSAASSSVVAL